MGEINIPRQEREALKAIDSSELSKAIDQCEFQGNSTALKEFKLFNCGEYVQSRLRYFEMALMNYRNAKSSKKCAETLREVQSAGRDLHFAVRRMQFVVDEAEKDDQLFQVDDIIMQPGRVSEQLSVRVGFQWRKAVEDSWSYSSITFTHNVVARPDFTTVQTKRKPSAAQQERTKQEKLYAEWNHLKSLSLHAVRDFFKNGGSGFDIPATFRVRPDAYTGGLNNHSANFWQDQK